MVPKTFSFLSLAILLCSFTCAFATHYPPSESANALRPSLKFTFENCVAYGGGSSQDYSEFVAESISNPECSTLSVLGNNLFRLNPYRNPHSCAPGMNGTTAMCISSSEFDSYSAGDEKSIRVNVLVEPGPDGVGSLDNMAFFSKAPEFFQFIDGDSGPNNYPTKFGVRILTEAGEIYRSSEIPTNRDWTYRYFDFSSVVAATVTTPTVFRIEILPYSLAGIASHVTAWDIEDLMITGGCSSVNGGSISTTSPTDFCSDGTQNNTVDVALQGAKGETFSYILAREDDFIQAVSNSSTFNMASYPNGNYRIFHIAYEGPLGGLSSGSFLYNLVGCFDLSNAIEVTNNVVRGGTLTGPSQTSEVTICPNQGNTVVATNLTGNSGDFLSYVLTDASGQIIGLYSDPNIDLGNIGDGSYRLLAVSYANISGLTNGTNLNNLSGCFAISSPINIDYIATPLDGGTLTTASGTNLEFCGNTTQVTVVNTGSIGSNNRFVITNAQGRILTVTANSQIDFGNINETTFNIWNIAYEDGLSGLVVDGLVSNLQGCFDLSNPVTITRNTVDAGSISVNGSDLSILCLKNNDNQAVRIDATGQIGDNILYLVTDESGEVLMQTQLDNNNSIDFNNSFSGVCLIWAVVYNGTIAGAGVGQNASTLTGDCFDLSNPVRVVRNEVESGSIDGPANYELCLNNIGERSLALEVTGNQGAFSSWLVTDMSGNVLETLPDGNVDFGNAPAGVCQVYHISHSDSLILYGSSDNINDIVLGCFELSEPVTVERKLPQGGALTLENGTTTVTLLLGQSATATLSTALTANDGEQSIYVVFDDQGTILNIQSSNEFDFNGNGPGICSIVNISYCGVLDGLNIGERIDMLEGCFSISNRITVTRENSMAGDTLNAGIIVTSSGMTEASVCIGDSSSDSLVVIFAQNPVGPESNYVVTDSQGEILEITSTPNFGFAGAGAGLCRIYHIVYEDSPLTGLVVGSNIATDLSGSFDLSEPIDVVRNVVSGGTLTDEFGQTTVDIVVNDGLVDVINLMTIDNVGDTSVIVLTDTSGEILGLPTAPLEFDTGVTETCLAWNLSYSSDITGLQVGLLVPDIIGCYALSNPLTINKTEFVAQDTVDGGTIITTDSLMMADLCLDFGTTSVDVILEGAIGDTSSYLITNDSGLILELQDNSSFDFEGVSAGVCQIWNISWNDQITGLMAGNNVSAVMGDFDLSNPITVTRDVVDGGTIMTSDSMTSISIVVGDGLIDSIDVVLEDNVGDNNVWLITDTQGEILELPAGPPFVFEDAGVGVCLIWHLSHADGLTGLAVGNTVAGLEGCFDVSNAITVERTAVPTAFPAVKFEFDSTTTSVDSNFCLPLLVTHFDSIDTFSGTVGWDTTFLSYTGVQAFGVPGFSATDFSTISAADGTLTFTWIDNSGSNPATLDSLATLFEVCFDYVGAAGTSSSVSLVDMPTPITVTRAQSDPSNPNSIPLTFNLCAGTVSSDMPPVVNGGTIMTADSMVTAELCLGTENVEVDVVLAGEVGEFSEYIIADTTGFILAVFSSPPFQYSTVGVCNIWHISYNGMITGLAAGQDLDTLSGDFDLSNPIEVIRDEADGGSLMTSDSLVAVSVMVGDGIIDSIEVILDGIAGDTTSWLITDVDGNILELPVGPPFTFEAAGTGVCYIWNLSYAFGLSGLEVGANVSDLEGCFDLSNSIEVTRTGMVAPLEGGTLMTIDSMMTAEICLASTSADVSVILDGAIGDSSIYVVADTSGVILALQDSTLFQLGLLSAGICEIWHLSYNGALVGLEVGENVDTLSGNFDFSNAVVVTKGDAEGGLIQFDDSSFAMTITVGDGVADTLDVILNSSAGDSTSWLLTTTTGVILDIDMGPQFVFPDSTAVGSCRIYHLAYTTGLMGLANGNNVNIDLDGCFDLSNFLVVDKIAAVNDSLIAGTIMTADSMTVVDLCTGDSGAELDLVLEGENGPISSWVVTDTTGIILATPATEPISFPADTSQVCELVHIVYDSILTGFAIGEDLDSLDGNFLLSNVVTVNKMQLLANSISLADGSVAATVTTNDGMTDSLTIVSSAISADTSVYIVTDTFGLISSLQDSTLFLFDNQPSGVCLIWEVSYNTGEFSGIITGTNVSTLSGCYAISNPVTVTKSSSAGLNGGVVTTAIGNNIEICLSDNPVDSVFVNLVGGVGDTMTWVITDTFGMIISLPLGGPPFALDTLSAGACQIWHLSFENPLTGLAEGSNVSDLVGNFDFSNPVNVDKNFSAGGSLMTATGMTFDTIFLGSDPVDSLMVNLSGSIVGENTSWVVTDTLGNILQLPTGPPFTFEGFAPGQCQVWHLAYDDNLSGLQIGNNVATDLNGCYSFSDSIQVVKVAASSSIVNGGIIATLDGTNMISVCQGNAEIDSSLIVISGQSGSNFNFIVTNTSGFILRVDDTINTVIDTVLVNVEGSPNATTLNLYHIAYETPLMTLAPGQQIANLQGIFDLSNPITLINENVNAGSFLPPDSITIMVGEGIVDSIDVTTFGTVQGDSTNWVVYDSMGMITEIDSGPPFTFENSGGGVFHITRLAYSFGLTGLSVGSNINDLDGCFDLVDPIVVTAIQATLAGGTLQTTDSLTTVNYCFNSTYALDSIDVILTDTIGEAFAWVVTDTSGLILDLPTAPPFLFDDMDPETCLVRNVSYEGTISGLALGEDLDTLMGSYLLSNPIIVNKEVVNGGTLSTPSGATMFEFCVGDGIPNVVNLTIADTLGGNYQYVVTDTFNSILLTPLAGSTFIDFEGFGDGVCYVYNMSATSEILGLTPGMNIDSLEGCYEFSNLITVVKNGVDGNQVLSSPIAVDDFISFCTSDGVLDSLTLSTNSTMGSYQYVITDENDEIDSVLVGNIIDFEGLGFGTCKIYGISYTGTFTGMPGDTVGVQAMASECFDVSAMPITVEKQDCSMPIITEILGSSQIEIKNIGIAPTDISGLYLCSDLNYDQISTLTVDCGSVILSPGDHVVLDLDANISLTTNDGEMGLYRSQQFGSFDDIMHYTEWGSAGHQRSGTAIGAGLWMANQFAVPFTMTTSLKYDGSGILETDWSEGAQTPCMDNIGGGGTGSRLSYTTYPNPTSGIFNLMIPEMQSEEGKLLIYDSYGKVVESRAVRAGVAYEIDLTKYGSGLFYTKVISGREGVVKKMLMVR